MSADARDAARPQVLLHGGGGDKTPGDRETRFVAYDSTREEKTAMVQFNAKSYRAQVNARAPRSRTLLYCFRAFLVGGLICCVGQLVGDLGKQWFALTEEQTASFTAIFMVFLGAALTGVGVYDKIGSFAGAGSVVPITGFANSIVAPAIEFKAEGFIMGTAAKMFTIAGPVLVYGIGSSILVGLAALILGAL